MLKPCPEDPEKCSCHICYLFRHDDRYRKLWDGKDDAKPAPRIVKPGKFLPTNDDYKAQTIDRAKRPCMYRGEKLAEQSVRCGTVPLYVCQIHEKCRTVGCSDDGVQICATCPEYVALDQTSTEQWVAKLTGPEPILDGGLYSLKQTNAVARIIKELRANLPAKPSFASERGIVTTGGGRYWSSAWTTCAIAREHGWKHPILCWYLGPKEFDAFWIEQMAALDVVCVDAYEVRAQKPYRILNGFEVKLYAAANSGIEQPLWLDADCYPCADPNHLYECRAYRATGSVHYPDLPNADPWTQWRNWGAAADDSPPIETGQYLYNLRECWEEVQIALKLNEMSDLTYHWDYGDKGPARVAWAWTKRKRAIYQHVPLWKGPAFIHVDQDDEPLFIHRCRGKVNTDNASFYTPQHGNGLEHHEALPGEDIFQHFKTKAIELSAHRAAAMAT